MTSFSQSRSFIGGAISTVASPLRSSCVDGSCRSPVTPRRSRPATRDHTTARPNNLQVNTEDARYAFPITPQFNKSISNGKLGTFSAINIILGKTVGVGIYSIPSSIFNSVGSVGASLLLWIIGSIISFCGLAVYLDLGTAIPRSGGERVYLERIFRKPRMLATCMFMSYVVLLGFSTPNCIVLGEYVMYALEVEVNRWNVRVVAVWIITVICVIHARYRKIGLVIINVLGVGKMLILVVVVISGIAGALMGVGPLSSTLARRRLSGGLGSFDFPEEQPQLSTAQKNFSNLFSGSSTQPYDYATALLKILYCFRGYSTANQVLSEVRNPIPTLRLAAPIALSLVSIGYILANVAYFLVVSKEDFRSSGVVIAGHFFKNIFGKVIGENVFPLFIIVSAFGNIAATSFAQARVNQELGKDGLLPFSRFFAGKNQWDSPTPGLFLHWLVSVLVIIVPPPGEIYNFLVDIGGYPVSVISVAISLGLLYLQSSPQEIWQSPFQAKKIYTVVFAASNCLLLVLPWIKPREEKGDGRFPYFAYPATALAILASGVLYWCWWAVLRPRLSGDEESWLSDHDGRRGHKRGANSPLQDEVNRTPSAAKEDGVRKRAPCGCPSRQLKPAGEAE
ncbi:amino acid transporter [Cadophora sp. DSE1049]|nr:amino acid transporter [Cadophora sp. DSE1049]